LACRMAQQRRDDDAGVVLSRRRSPGEIGTK
jgi:hypothetical protein